MKPMVMGLFVAAAAVALAAGTEGLGDELAGRALGEDFDELLHAPATTSTAAAAATPAM
jgi:hypothetical protein